MKFRSILKVHWLQVSHKSSERNSTIYVSKNEAVCCHVQAHFGRSFPASFTEKVLGTIQRFVCSKMKRLAMKLRRILELVLAMKAL